VRLLARKECLCASFYDAPLSSYVDAARRAQTARAAMVAQYIERPVQAR